MTTKLTRDELGHKVAECLGWDRDFCGDYYSSFTDKAFREGQKPFIRHQEYLLTPDGMMHLIEEMRKDGWEDRHVCVSYPEEETEESIQIRWFKTSAKYIDAYGPDEPLAIALAFLKAKTGEDYSMGDTDQ